MWSTKVEVAYTLAIIEVSNYYWVIYTWFLYAYECQWMITNKMLLILLWIYHFIKNQLYPRYRSDASWYTRAKCSWVWVDSLWVNCIKFSIKMLLQTSICKTFSSYIKLITCAVVLCSCHALAFSTRALVLKYSSVSTSTSASPSPYVWAIP